MGRFWVPFHALQMPYQPDVCVLLELLKTLPEKLSRWAECPSYPSFHFAIDQNNDLGSGTLLKIPQVHTRKLQHPMVFWLHKHDDNTISFLANEAKARMSKKKRNTDSSLVFWENGIKNIPPELYSECVLLGCWYVYKIAFAKGRVLSGFS